MDDVLLGIVLRRLEHFPLAEQATDFLLAALESDESLSAQLGGQAAGSSLDTTPAVGAASGYAPSGRGRGACPGGLAAMGRPARCRADGRCGWAAYLDPDTATRAAYLTAALSHACHYHPYELAPTAAELTGWLDQAAQIVTLMQAASATSASQG